MSKKIKHISCFLLLAITVIIAFFYFNSQGKINTYESKKELILNAINEDNKELFKADSLFVLLNLSKALILYDKILLKKTTTPGIRRYITNKLIEIQYEFGINSRRYQPTNFRSEAPLSIFALFYEDFRKIDKNVLKEQLHLANFKSDSIQIEQNLSLYYDLVEYNYDSSMIYTELSQHLLSENSVFTIYHLRHTLQFINLLSYERKNIEAIDLANRALIALKTNNNSELIFTELLLEQRAYLSLRLEQYTDCQKDIDRILNTANGNKCSQSYQRAIKLQLYLYIYKGNTNAYNQTIEKYSSIEKACEKEFINIAQIQGRFFANSGMMDEALIHLEKARDWYNKYDAAHVNTRKNINYMLSEAYMENGQFDNSIESYLQNLAIGTREINITDLIETKPLHEYYYIDLLRIGSILFKKWRAEKSLETLELAHKTLLKSHEESKNVLNTFNENKILRFIDFENELYSQLVSISHELYSQSNNKIYLEKAWEYTALKNNLIFQKDILTIYANQNIPKHLKDKIIENQKMIKEEMTNGLLNNKNLRHLYVERNDLDSLISNHSIERSIKDELTENNSLSDTQKNISKNESILSISADNEYVYIFHITKENFKAHRRSHNNTIAQQIIEYNNFITSQSQSVKEYKKIANELFKFVIGSNILSKTKEKLIIVLDNTLSPLSIESLTLDSTGTNFTNLNYLVKNKNVSYSMNNYFFMSPSNSNKRLSDKKILAFSFSDKATLSQNQTQLPELKGTHDEIELLRSISKYGIFYTGCNATKLNFLKAISTSYDIIHIATHGRVNSEIRDDIKLYFRNTTCGIDSLLGFELLNKSFNGAEVILSACESNKSYTKNNSETYNFTRYLFMAGAKKVISSQWKLNDQVSFQLISKYYEEEDLTKAKISIINEPESAHPYYWASLKEYRS